MTFAVSPRATQRCSFTAASFSVTNYTKKNLTTLYFVLTQLCLENDTFSFLSQRKSKWQTNVLQQSKSANIMLINRESRGSAATVQLFQTSIVLIVAMMRRSSFGGGNQEVATGWDGMGCRVSMSILTSHLVDIQYLSFKSPKNSNASSLAAEIFNILKLNNQNCTFIQQCHWVHWKTTK